MPFTSEGNPYFVVAKENPEIFFEKIQNPNSWAVDPPAFNCYWRAFRPKSNYPVVDYTITLYHFGTVG